MAAVPSSPAAPRIALAVGAFLLVVLVVVLFTDAPVDPTKAPIVNFFMALAVGLLAHFIAGQVTFRGEVLKGSVTAAGGFALFLIVFFGLSPLDVKSKVADVAPQVIPASEEVAAAQEALASVGVYEGAIDGIPDSPTVEAIQEFQEAQGLPADGLLGPATVEQLSQIEEGDASRFGDEAAN